MWPRGCCGSCRPTSRTMSSKQRSRWGVNRAGHHRSRARAWRLVGRAARGRVLVHSWCRRCDRGCRRHRAGTKGARSDHGPVDRRAAACPRCHGGGPLEVHGMSTRWTNKMHGGRDARRVSRTRALRRPPCGPGMPSTRSISPTTDWPYGPSQPRFRVAVFRATNGSKGAESARGQQWRPGVRVHGVGAGVVGLAA